MCEIEQPLRITVKEGFVADYRVSLLVIGGWILVSTVLAAFFVIKHQRVYREYKELHEEREERSECTEEKLKGGEVKV